jgi:hypothetical protein
MKAAVQKIMVKTPGFTIEKPKTPKGYMIKLSVKKIEKTGGNTKCGITGEIVRYPKQPTAKGDGWVMVTTSWTGNATASGTSDNSVIDACEAIAEDMATKSIQQMRIDWAKW